MAVATARELAEPPRAAITNDVANDVSQHRVDAAPASSDDSIAQQEALDPVGAGHELSR
jgi:hypothetical protein